MSMDTTVTPTVIATPPVYMSGQWIRRSGDVFQPTALMGSPNKAPNKDNPVPQGASNP